MFAVADMRVASAAWHVPVTTKKNVGASCAGIEWVIYLADLRIGNRGIRYAMATSTLALLESVCASFAQAAAAVRGVLRNRSRLGYRHVKGVAPILPCFCVSTTQVALAQSPAFAYTKRSAGPVALGEYLRIRLLARFVGLATNCRHITILQTAPISLFSQAVRSQFVFVPFFTMGHRTS